VTLGVWSILLVLSGSYEQLFQYSLFSSFIFHAITALALFTLRRKQPDLPRPYRVVGYPWVPALFLAVMIGLVLNTLRERPVQSLLGLGIVALGVPFFQWQRRTRYRSPIAESIYSDDPV
jgi:APA family basic amino acid/polyamine antiporter